MISSSLSVLAVEAGPDCRSSTLSLAHAEEHSLTRAFAGFAAAAVSLERSYQELQSEVVRLRHELEDRNRALARSLEENFSMRQHLDHILESLPCGVVVIEPDQQISVANPEARRLLGATPQATFSDIKAAPWAWELETKTHPGMEHEY